MRCYPSLWKRISRGSSALWEHTSIMPWMKKSLYLCCCCVSGFLCCRTKGANDLNPVIISKIAFVVNGKQDEKLTSGEMLRNAELILKCNQKSALLIVSFFSAPQKFQRIIAAMSVTKLPASSPVIKFTQTDLELYRKILTKVKDSVRPFAIERLL